jgi:FlaA1/EpsC-like NDP-sugar epimerase
MISGQIRPWLKELFRTTPLKRKLFFLIADAFLITLSLVISFWLRFAEGIPPRFMQGMIIYILPALLVKIGFLAYFGLYGISWRFFGIMEAVKLIKAVTLGSIVLTLFFFLLKNVLEFRSFPRSVFVVDYLFTLSFLMSLRTAKRAFREYVVQRTRKSGKGVRTLVIGAGASGQAIVREMLTSSVSEYMPVGYIDDDPAKKDLVIQGIKVLGRREAIPTIMKEYQVGEALVAMPSASSTDVREIIRLIRSVVGTQKIKILPSVLKLMSRGIALRDIQEVRVEELLGRTPVSIDFETIRSFVLGKRVLITGAAGSIGSELTRTVSQFGPRALFALDNDETELFYLLNRMKQQGAVILPVIGDVRDAAKIEAIISDYRPEIIIHSAAYKHVPILERFAGEAVKTNILGTMNVAEAAIKHDVGKFVLISTDKAINPTSVMGATKRVAEEVLATMSRRNGTKFVSVRFGNVLGSRGSVIPVFKEQIQRGGPVTVTHPDMKRYFMAIAEAVLLVLEAAAIGEGGDTYILDMGEPVRIEDLAREMIRLSGYEPGSEIPIVYSGLRPGEKLFEDLFGKTEELEPMKFDKIFKLKKLQTWEEGPLFELIGRLRDASEGGGSKGEIVDILRKLVSTYKPDPSDGRALHW